MKIAPKRDRNPQKNLIFQEKEKEEVEIDDEDKDIKN
jgi:hypothetical protein